MEALEAAREAAAAKAALVNIERVEEYDIDAGNMAGTDVREVPLGKLLGSSRREALTTYTRDNVQLLLNSIMQLPVDKTEEGVFATMPRPASRIPREKPIPEDRAQTRWEKFAEMKGIQKSKRSRMVYDEATGEYRPRYGYKRSKQDDSAWPWVELKDNEDPYVDKFQELSDAKKNRVLKNEGQRIKNIAAARLQASGRKVNPAAIKKELKTAIQIGRTSTASAGVFDTDLKGEAKLKRAGKRVQRAAVTGLESKEKQAALKMLERMSKKSSGISTAKGTKNTQTKQTGSNKKRKPISKAGKQGGKRK